MRWWLVAMVLTGSAGWCRAAPPPSSCPEILAHYELSRPGATAEATVLQVEVMPSGRLVSAKVICSSGDRRLDETVLDGVERKQFPPFSGTAPRLLIIPFIVRPGG